MSLFSLGYRIVARCSLSGKILMVAGLFCIPIGIMFSSLNIKYQEVIDFADSEIRGVHVINPVMEMLFATQRHRSLMQKLTLGENAPLKKEIIIQEDIFDLALKQALIKAKNLGFMNEKAKMEFSRIQEDWKKNTFATANRVKNFELHNKTVEDILSLISIISDESQLTLDPDLASYYVMDMIIVRIPAVNEYMSKLRGMGIIALSQKKISDEDRKELFLLRELLKKDLEALSSDSNKVSHSRPDIKNVSSLERWKQGIESLIKIIDKNIMLSNEELLKSSYSADEFFKVSSSILSQTMGVYTVNGQILLDLLNERKQKQMDERNRMIVILAILSFIIWYLFLSIRSLVKRDVKNLQTLAEGLSHGIFDQKVHLIAKDELWSIGQSVYQAIEAVRHVVKDVDVLSEAGRQGQLDVRADATGHQGGYRDLVLGLNQTLDAIVLPLNLAATQIASIAKGNIPKPIEKNFSGSFQMLVGNLNKATTSIQRLIDDANALVKNAVDGKLNYRANTQYHEGDFRKIIEGVNATLDTVIEPLTLTIDYVDQLSKGVLPPPVSKEYRGDFSRLAQSLNTAIFAIKGIVEDINILVTALQKGDLNARADQNRHRGEYAVIIQSVNKGLEAVAEPIKRVGQILEHLAQGDLSHSIQTHYPGHFADLANSTNTTVHNLQEMVGSIYQVVYSISTAAREIAEGNTDLSQRTEQQAVNLEKTSSALEKLANAVKHNAKSSYEANQVAINTFEIAEKGNISVGKVVKTMEEISSSSKQISEIITVIDSIAFQTNILALNAAVEAARAGEQGRGFAVVASEVRNLAQRSATAAKEIKVLISGSVERVQSGARTVNEAGEIMLEMKESVKSMTQIMQGISNASQEQTTDIEHIHSAVSQIDQSTQQNAALVEEAAAAAESLEEQIRNLEGMVKAFKLQKQFSSTLSSAHLPTDTGSVSNPLETEKSIQDSWEEF